MVHILDDFRNLAKTRRECQHLLNAFVDKSIYCHEKEPKVDTFVDRVLDSLKMEACLLTDKLIEYHDAISNTMFL